MSFFSLVVFEIFNLDIPMIANYHVIEVDSIPATTLIRHL